MFCVSAGPSEWNEDGPYDRSTGGEESPPTSGAEAAAAFAAAGGMDELFAKIDAGELELTGTDGFIPGLIKAALERGLAAELTDQRQWVNTGGLARFR